MNVAVGDYVLRGPASERFAAARSLGVDGLELRFGPQDLEHHPLFEPGQPAELRSRARAAGIILPSAYVGYAAAHPLSHPDRDTRQRHAALVARVLQAADEAGVRTVVLPLFGASEPRDETAVVALIDTLRPLAEMAAARGLVIGLETALPVTAVLVLLQRLNHSAVRVAYDVGTAGLLGHDPVAELRLLAAAVGQLRVRDSTADGRRVPLGQGVMGAQWAALRSGWLAADPDSWCVLEVPPTGEPLEWARAELAFLHQADYIRGNASVGGLT